MKGQRRKVKGERENQQKLKAESIKSLTEPAECSEKKQLYSVTSESSARDKKVILTADTHGQVGIKLGS